MTEPPRCPECELFQLRTQPEQDAGICRWCANPAPAPEPLTLAIGDVVLTGADAARVLAGGGLAPGG